MTKFQNCFLVIWTLDLIWPASALTHPAFRAGVKGHNVNEISIPGSVALWAESFNFEL
jgi:hypothetical protein